MPRDRFAQKSLTPITANGLAGQDAQYAPRGTGHFVPMREGMGPIVPMTRGMGHVGPRGRRPHFLDFGSRRKPLAKVSLNNSFGLFLGFGGPEADLRRKVSHPSLRKG